MFGLCCLRRKKKQEHLGADEKKQHSCLQRSVPDTPAPSVAPVSAKPAETKRKKRKHRLLSHFEKNKNEEKPSTPQESDATSDAQTTTPNKTGKKTSWWCLPFKCCRRRCRVAPAAQDEEKKSSPELQRRSPKKVNKTDEQDKHGQSSSFSHQDEVMPFTDDNDGDPELEESLQLHDDLLPDVPSYADIIEQAWLMALLKEKVSSATTSHATFSDGVKGSTITADHFGFPNIGQSCYMNSSLQSLLTLEAFVRDISCQERVWSSVPEAQLMRRLMEIRDTHSSEDLQTKSRLLCSFKEAVSVQAPEFRDRQQKDAHEFLSSVLAQMRSLSPLLQEVAASMGRSYTCPVEDHLVFRMENIRTCKRCGAHSTRQEEFTNLSLDLVPGASIEQMLEEYVKETELEFRCECGGKTSGQSSTFATLPKVLVLHLKRFRFTPSFWLEKAHDPVMLLRDLVVSSKEDGGCYSLVSIISHFGSTEAGHYICDGIHPDDRPDEPTDRWLTYNDSAVSESTGSSICEQRQESAYVLFYKRQV